MRATSTITMIDRSAYPTHADLLSQVADSTEERDAVRRVLGGLTEHELDAQERYKRAPFPIGAATHAHRHARPACSRCESGLTQCTTPDACQISAERPPLRRGDRRALLALAIGSWAIVAAAIGVALYAMGVRL